MPPTMTMAGSAVDSSDTASPWITLVPWAGDGCLSDRVHRALVGAGIVFGDHNDQGGHDEAENAAEEQVQTVMSVPATVRWSPSRL